MVAWEIKKQSWTADDLKKLLIKDKLVVVPEPKDVLAGVSCGMYHQMTSTQQFPSLDN